MNIEEIITLRRKLPDDWRWHKCYELAYVNTRTGRDFIKKHWAITSPDNKGSVHSLGLISHDNTSTKEQFFSSDIPVQWVEKSLGIVDTLLAEIDRLKSLSSPLPKETKKEGR